MGPGLSSSAALFTLALFCWLSAGHSAAQHEYLGVPVGLLHNASHGITGGQVWLANATAVQISDFSIEPHQKQELLFAFMSEEGVEPVKFLYKVVQQANNEEVLVPVKKRLNSGISERRLVALVPRGSVDQWRRFGLVTGKGHKQLTAVPLNKPAPQPFCCLRDKENPNQGIIGDHYSAGTGPVEVVDSKTLILHKLSLEANRAPDAWIFAGKGEVRQSTGKKALVIGRDTLTRHCSLRDFYSGDSDMRVRLAPGQDVYQLDYLSLFCYQYDVDFGHISFQLDPVENPVPAAIPELIREGKGQQQQQEEAAPELLESNDVDTC